MNRRFVLTATLTLAMALISAVPAFAVVGAPTPPEGMVGITSVVESDPNSLPVTDADLAATSGPAAEPVVEQPVSKEEPVAEDLIKKELAPDEAVQSNPEIFQTTQAVSATKAADGSLTPPAIEAENDGLGSPIFYTTIGAVVLLGLVGAFRWKASKN